MASIHEDWHRSGAFWQINAQFSSSLSPFTSEVPNFWFFCLVLILLVTKAFSSLSTTELCMELAALPTRSCLEFLEKVSELITKKNQKEKNIGNFKRDSALMQRTIAVMIFKGCQWVLWHLWKRISVLPLTCQSCCDVLLNSATTLKYKLYSLPHRNVHLHERRRNILYIEITQLIYARIEKISKLFKTIKRHWCILFQNNATNCNHLEVLKKVEKEGGERERVFYPRLLKKIIWRMIEMVSLRKKQAIK